MRNGTGDRKPIDQTGTEAHQTWRAVAALRDVMT
jgi:hypothetical protein